MCCVCFVVVISSLRGCIYVIHQITNSNDLRDYNMILSFPLLFFVLRYNYLSHLAKWTHMTQQGETQKKERTATESAMLSYNMCSLASSLQVCLHNDGVFEI